MTVEHAIDHEKRLITTTWHGSLNEQDLLDSFCNYYRNILPQCRGRQYNELFDLSNASITGFSANGIKRLLQTANAYDVHGEDSKRAAIFSNKIPMDLGRLYLSYRNLLYTGKTEARIFRHRDDALEWIMSDKAESIA